MGARNSSSGSRPSGAPSSQGDKKPTILRKPPLTRSKDMAPTNQGNTGPGYGKLRHKGS
jgi:hypothetical protein